MTMQPLPLTDESYALESTSASSKKLVNLYVEQLPADARSATILRNTPGLVPFITVGSGPIIEMNTALTSSVYALSGTHFYRLTKPGTTTPLDLGSVGTSTGYKPTIAVGTLSACVCIPPNAYVVDHSGSASTAVAQITDTNFTTSGANSVTYIDGRFVFTSYNDDNEFFCTDLLNGSTVTALNFAYADGRPNIITKALVHQGNIWFAGSGGLEAWADEGYPNFPYGRQPGSDIAFGCFNTATFIECDNAIMFLGDGAVYRLDGYTISKISSSALDEWIRDNCDYVNVEACAYAYAGRDHYVLNFTGAFPRSVAYDALTKRWHDRNSGAGFWLGRSAANFNSANNVGLPQGSALIGDRTTGVIYHPIPMSNADNGVIQTHVLTMPNIYAQTKRAFMARLELQMETGIALTNNAIMLEISDDGGNTYRTKTPAQISGPTGNGRYRVAWTRLGSFRERILRFTFYDIVNIYSVFADIEQGEW
jgi:hypothetical protein